MGKLRIVALLLLVMVVALPATVEAAEDKDIQKVPIAKQPTDPGVLEAIEVVGADREYVQLAKDYGLKSEGKSPYSRTYIDLKNFYSFMEVSILPMVDAGGGKLIPGWLYSDGKFVNYSMADSSLVNLFWAEIIGTEVRLIARNDQPGGVRQYDEVIYNPQLFLNGKEILPSIVNANLYAVDPYNPNYQDNVLEWHYGICKRQIRIVEGMFRETWVFDQNPHGDVKIVHNQEGDYRLQLGQYAINDDIELVPAEAFNDPLFGYPFRVSGSATYYPDASPEGTSVDGYAGEGTNKTWANIIADGGDVAGDDIDILYGHCGTQAVNGEWSYLYRMILVFDTSGLPDDATVTATTLSMYGNGKVDDTSNAPTINIVSSAPASNTAVVAGDYNSLGNVDTAPFCDTPITYANWNIGTPGTINNFLFNATGRAAISTTGPSRFGTKIANYDYPGATPPTWGNTEHTGMYAWASDKGEGYKPKLVITYASAPDPPTNVSATDGNHTDKGVITWTKSIGATKYEVFRDTVGLGELGDVATFDDNGAGAPSITPGCAVSSDGSSTSNISLSLDGTSANAGDTHSYTVKAGNAADEWSGDSASDTGYRGVGALTYQWQRSSGDADEDYGNIGGAVSSTYIDTATPGPSITPGSTVSTDGTETAHIALSLAGTSANPGAGRYYQCILNATGVVETNSGSNRGYRGVGALQYQWQRSSSTGCSDFGNLAGATNSTHNDATAPAGAINNTGNATASDGASAAHVAISLAGESKTDGEARCYRCLLTATGAGGETSASNAGYRGTGAISYQWQRSSGDSDADYGNIGGGTTDPYNDTDAPADGSGRYFQCVLDSAGAAQQTSNADRGFRRARLLVIYVDGVEKATASFPSGVPNTAANWTYYQNMGGFWDYTEISINGTVVQRIDWEYDTIFYDSSGFDNDATPSFISTSSDADVSAELVSFLPVQEAKAPPWVLGEAPAFFREVPVIVSEWDVVPPVGTFPFAMVISAVANATGTPSQLPLVIIAGFTIIALSLAYSSITKRYGSGSIFVKLLVICGVMGIFIGLKNFGIEFWMLFVFAVIGCALALGSRHTQWQ